MLALFGVLTVAFFMLIRFVLFAVAVVLWLAIARWLTKRFVNVTAWVVRASEKTATVVSKEIERTQ